MLLICKSCKKIIDTNKHDFCPKCGANFNYSEGLSDGTRTEDYAEYQRNREHEEEMRRIEEQNRQIEERNRQIEENSRKAELESRQVGEQIPVEKYIPPQPQHTHNHGTTLRASQYETKRRLQAQSDKRDGKKNGCVGCLGFAVIIFVMIVDMFFGGIEELFEKISGDSEYSHEISQVGGYVDDYIEEETADFFNDYEEDIPQYITNEDGFIIVGINEFACTDRYLFGCTEIREGGVSDYQPDEGNMFVTFRFEIESVSGEKMYYFGYPTMYADGEKVNFSALADEPLFLAGELDPFEGYEGYMTYEVPIDTEVFEITYNNEVKVLLKNHFRMQ